MSDKTKPTPEAIRATLKIVGHDGHSIYGVEEFDDLGLPAEFLDRFITVHKSHGTNPKGMIFGEGGKVLPELRGVYGLDLLWGLAYAIGADTQAAAEKMGRGFQAQALTSAIYKVLNTLEDN